jgi:CHRD domain/PEP-CTERM motif
MNVRTLVASATLAACALAQAPALAHEQVYFGLLSGSNEVPAARTNGQGWARITLDFDLVTMRVEAAFDNLIGNVTAAHIHCCTAPGSNVGVATMTPTFTGFPSGVTAGSYDQTFNMALATSYNAAYVNNNGGTVGSAFNALTAGLDAGKAYFNLHTSSFPGGEIRAVLTPVPEPTISGLALVGLVLVGAALRQRRQA